MENSGIYNKIIMYDNENMVYLEGDVKNAEISHEPFSGIKSTFIGNISNYDETQTIQLDETLMKRIAKYNKIAEIKELEKIIEDKKTEIKELDDMLKDKDKRVQKLKEFVANLYDLDLTNYDDYDD